MKTKEILILIIMVTIILLATFTTVLGQEIDEPVGTEGLGEGMTAQEMVNYQVDLTRGMTSHGTMEMIIVTPDWERSIEMEWWEHGEEEFLVRVHKPSRDEGNGTLKIGNNLWNYVYSHDQTIHIPPAMMMQSWMGSDFTNDDMIRESSLIDDYTHVLEGIEEMSGEECYVIYMSTDPSTPVPWLTMRIWLRTEDLLPVRQEYYNDDGELARYMEFWDFEFMHDRVVPLRFRMVPLDKEGDYTELVYIDVEFNIELDDDTFTLSTLENPDI